MADEGGFVFRALISSSYLAPLNPHWELSGKGYHGAFSSCIDYNARASNTSSRCVRHIPNLVLPKSELGQQRISDGVSRLVLQRKTAARGGNQGLGWLSQQ